MIREQLIEKGVGDNKKFRWRSHEPSRIEGLSDAVFGFAVTLLVVSLEVPKTFAELKEVMRGFGAFAICFALLIVVWYNQYKFFRRYALQDNYTLVLNSALLFVVLFYVYPLKFVFKMVIDQLLGFAHEPGSPPTIRSGRAKRVCCRLPMRQSLSMRMAAKQPSEACR